MMDDERTSDEVTALLQGLIRNECVNDGSPESGHERRSVDLLRDHLEGPGLDLEVFEPSPGRASLVARIEGRRRDAPSLLLLGHTDVVPANADRWRRDPFGGELVDGEVWGRGAVDMLNLTASMAVAVRGLADQGFAPEGDLIYVAVADEEALGEFGAEHLTEHEADAVVADYVLTEAGGIPIPTPGGTRLPVIVGEKGAYWCRLVVRGAPGHGSQPHRTDNAVIKAAEVVRRLGAHQPETQIHDVWRRFVTSLGYPEEIAAPLLDPHRLMDALDGLPIAMARQFHACTHTTIAPNVIGGGSKINTIPDEVVLEVDIRTLPGQTEAEVRTMLEDVLGGLSSDVDIELIRFDASTASPMDTPLWDSLARTTQRFYEGSALIPMLTVGATDARFFRSAGSTAYGFGLFSRRLTFEDYGVMFHGDDERVDVDSLLLSTRLWEAVAEDLVGARS